MLWHSKAGANITLKYRRFVDAGSKHLILQQISITSDKDTEIEVLSKIDADVRTNGRNHFVKTGFKKENNTVFCNIETDCQNKVDVVFEMSGDNWNNRKDGELSRTITLETNKEVVLEKRSVFTTDRDRDVKSCLEILEDNRSNSFDDLFTRHADIWAKRWEKCDVEIEGDDESQLATRVSLYHLLRSHVDDDRVAICAKGFAGEAYWGLFFWDTEMFMMPFFLYTDPAKAKTLTDFRIKTLPNAKKNAESYNCSGARFPWQSDHEGNECCAKSLWQYRDHEIHVTADVVYGFLHYSKATGNIDYLTKDAAETIIETCRFWMDRIDYIDGKPALLGVMGPDEYNPFFNNNAFTNRLVKSALSIGCEIGPENGVSKDEIRKWKFAADELPILKRKDGLILQHESFENLAEPDFDKYWKDKTKPYGGVVQQDRNYISKSSKQPDVLQMMFLFANEFSKEEIKQAWDYYHPYCTHDSSLSPGIHGLIASRLGLNDIAWDYWKKTSMLDLDVEKGKAAQGIHIAGSAATWQFLVFGFAGVKHAVESDILSLSPNLPDKWTKLSFPVIWKGQQIKISINSSSVSIENKSDKKLEAVVWGRKIEIEAESTRECLNEN